MVTLEDISISRSKLTLAIITTVKCYAKGKSDDNPVAFHYHQSNLADAFDLLGQMISEVLIIRLVEFQFDP